MNFNGAKSVFFKLRKFFFLAVVLFTMPLAMLSQDFIYMRNEEVKMVKRIDIDEEVIHFKEIKPNECNRCEVFLYEVDRIVYRDGTTVDYSHYKKNIEWVQEYLNGKGDIITKGPLFQFKNKFSLGVSGAMCFPRARYDYKETIFFNGHGFAKFGWQGAIDAAYYLTERFSVGLEYGMFRNPSSEYVLSYIFQIPGQRIPYESAQLEISDWINTYVVFNPSLTVPIAGTYFELGGRIGYLYTQEPLVSVNYSDNSGGLNSYSTVPADKMGLVAGLDMAWTFRLWRGLFASYQLNYLSRKSDLKQTHYLQNGVKYEYEKFQKYPHEIRVFNLGVGIKVVL